MSITYLFESCKQGVWTLDEVSVIEVQVKLFLCDGDHVFNLNFLVFQVLYNIVREG